MTLSFIYPHCTNILKCNTNHSWDLFTDGEELIEGPDFEVKESCSYMADITFSDFSAVPFRDYYLKYPSIK